MASAFATLEDLIEALLSQHVSQSDIKQILANQATILKDLDDLKTAWGALKAEVSDTRGELDDIRADVLGIAQFLGAAPASNGTPAQLQAIDNASAQLAQTNTALDAAIKQQENT